ncbi:MAG TPA: DUF423 domain-containing protein [Fibrobacteria bacterium]|nr:DUF423 domain-containing protein [Fibrobacteria bacterium]
MLGFSGIWGALAVVFGAFGAHALRSRLPPDLMAVWATGAQYHLVHAVVLLALALADRAGVPCLRLPYRLLAAGSVLFSGSLYALALSGIRGFGVVTPVGGVLLLSGWLAFAWAGTFRRGGSPRPKRSRSPE